MLLAVVVAIGAPLTAMHGTKHPTLGVDNAQKHPTLGVDKMGNATNTTCGVRDGPACTFYDPVRDITIHQCASDGHPTIGAVITSPKDADIEYTCQPCGEPNEAACECTHDNNHNPLIHVPDRTKPPCIGSMSHWCRYQPQYLATTEDGERFACKMNLTDAPEQEQCGIIGNEACLNIYSMSYSCISPDPITGIEVDAVLYYDPDIHRRHDQNAAYRCRKCGTEGAYACDCSTATNCPTAPAGTTIYCENSLNMIDSDIPGKFYCNSPDTEVTNGISPPSSPSP
jgi:hypothetical protein